ncbi:MAG TPA: GntR family transcriptional regulator [Geminicoccus sp.]|jgi:GntR family transcriptional regulator|uniref:GntR family transcriptional regulator n=1 Tax=Geminicoccus sp. TaxID=2024832 RepID=UPI002E349F1A|nr:GntR family transcriptional regulator [Geminicoccus sp.]HEX2528043.1 GntR family transcriptional regulator [Geminicoccus sp.]
MPMTALERPAFHTSSAVERASRAVAAMIGDGGLRPGARLPSEADLGPRLGVSRATLREAMKLLEQDGLIQTRHGSGRYVTAAAALKVERPITTYESISQMLRRQGWLPEVDVLSVEVGAPEAETATALQLEPDHPVVRIERLYRHADKPLVFCIDAVPADLLPELPDHADLSASLNDLLERHGCRPRMSTANVSAVILPKPLAQRYRVTGLDPWLLVTETCLADDGRPVMHARDHHRGDIFSFNFSRR